MPSELGTGSKQEWIGLNGEKEGVWVGGVSSLYPSDIWELWIWSHVIACWVHDIPFPPSKTHWKEVWIVDWGLGRWQCTCVYRCSIPIRTYSPSVSRSLLILLLRAKSPPPNSLRGFRGLSRSIHLTLTLYSHTNLLAFTLRYRAKAPDNVYS